MAAMSSPGPAASARAPFWATSKTPIAPPTSANPTVGQLVYAGVLTGSWSAVLCLVIYGIARLFGVSFNVVLRSTSVEAEVQWYVVLIVPFVFAVGGALLASLVRGWRGAGALVFWVGTAIAVGSCLVPLVQPGDVGWSSRVVLTLMHALTWFLVVPQIARIVGDSEPGRHEERPDAL